MGLERKVAIIGMGHVGPTTAFSLATQGLCSELVLIDIDEKKAEGDAIDLEDAVAHLPIQVKIKVNDYEAAAKSDIVIMAAGKILIEGQTRLDKLDEAKEIIDEVVPKLVNLGFNGIFLNITNPCDVITYHILKVSGFPSHKVFGTGTGLDSSRLRKIIGKLLDVAPRSVEGYSMGEHGDSQMVPWSHVSVGGKPLLQVFEESEQYRDIDLDELIHQVVYAGWEVLLRKGATYYGIGTVAADIVRAVFNDENRVLPVSAYLQGEYGQKELYIGVPAIINAQGVKQIVEITLTSLEQEKFNQSATIIKTYINKLN